MLDCGGEGREAGLRRSLTCEVSYLIRASPPPPSVEASKTTTSCGIPLLPEVAMHRITA